MNVTQSPVISLKCGLHRRSNDRHHDASASQFDEPDCVFLALGLMRVISVLSQSSHYRHYTISDLEWLVVPPLRLGQCAILHAETPGLPVAAAVALWASVSPEVDLKISQNLTVPIRLRPDEWRSGDILWLVDVIGSPDAGAQLLTRLQRDAFKGRQIKVRRRDLDGHMGISFVGA